MPNWCRVIVTAPGAVIKAFTRRATEEELNEDLVSADENYNRVDFEMVLPTPPETLHRCGGGWFEWRIENWGTKWNPDTIKVGETHVDMQTAWDPPTAFFRHLSKAFPEDTIMMEFANEDFGEGCGVMKIRGGEVEAETKYVGGPEKDELYERLWGFKSFEEKP